MKITVAKNGEYSAVYNFVKSRSIDGTKIINYKHVKSVKKLYVMKCQSFKKQ